MHSLIVSFFSLPPLLLVIFFFVPIGGAIGTLLSFLVMKAIKKKENRWVATFVCVWVSVQFSPIAGGHIRASIISSEIVARIKQKNLFSLIFSLNPEAEKELRERIANITKQNYSPEDFAVKIQGASGAVVTKYLRKYILSASEEVVYKEIQREALVLADIQSKPELCVSYYLGVPQLAANDVAPEFLAEDENLKIDIIESSLRDHSIPPKVASADEIIKIVAAAYRQKGFEPRDLKNVGRVATLPPTEGCRIATELSISLASLDKKQSVYVVKSSLYLSGVRP